MKKFSKKNNGFSHFELVLLVVVVAIIASVGFFVYNKNNNKSKADSVTQIYTSRVTCEITAVNSNPKYGTVQRPIITVINKSGKPFNAAMGYYTVVNDKTTDYPLDLGMVKNGTRKNRYLPKLRVPYADSSNIASFGVDYADPINDIYFKCSKSFTLPREAVTPVTVYRYMHPATGQRILNTDPNLSKNVDFKGFRIEPGKEFKAFDKSVIGTKPVYALLYPNGVVYSNKTDEIANCKEPNCRKGDMALFYAYEKGTNDRIPIYSVKRIYSPSNDMIILYTPDLSEAQNYQKNYGFEVTTAFWAQK